MAQLKKSVSVDLTDVPQTLLLPLWGRAHFSQHYPAVWRDPHAVSVVAHLDYDFATLARRMWKLASFWWVARAYHFDKAIRKFLRRHPTGVVINLGAGLDTAFERVDNGRMHWVDLDLPEVMALREQIFPAEARVHVIAKSILDFSWISEVQALGEHFFFFAGGVLTYFPEAEVKNILLTMAEAFPGAEIMFDPAMATNLPDINKFLKHAQMKNAALQWGMRSLKDPEQWSPRLKVVRTIPYFKGLKWRPGLPLSIRYQLFRYDWRDKSQIVQLRFGD